MLDRRTLIGAGLAAPFIHIRAAEAANNLTDYVVLMGNNTGSAEELDAGFRLKGGAYDDPASGVRLFSRFTVPGGTTLRTLRFKLIREVIPQQVTSNGVWFNVGVVWGRTLSAVQPNEPTNDTATAAAWDGWRITMANKAAVASQSNRLRLVYYKPRTQLKPRESTMVNADFAPNAAHEVVVTWKGTLITIAVPTMGTGVKQSWSHTQLKVPASGARLMWYGSPGGSWRVENVRLP
jgi:hypothetical protein